MPLPSSKITVSNLSKSFGRHAVLRDVNFQVKAGESLVIVGGSGTGKSVTLKCLLGLLSPDHGKIEIDGQDINTLTKHQRQAVSQKIGMLFQGGALFDSLPIWENVTFALLSHHHYSKKQAYAKAVELLEEVGLEPFVADKYPAELSGGMQKRVALARAIATQPEIIFFDEPTAGLDPIMCSIIDNLIEKCVKKLGASTITITHDMRSVRRIADHVALLFEGKIIWTGTVKEMDTTDNPYVQQFINGNLTGPMT